MPLFYLNALPFALIAFGIGFLVTIAAKILFKRTRAKHALPAILGILALHLALFFQILEYEDERMAKSEMHAWSGIQAIVDMVYLLPLTAVLALAIYLIAQNLELRFR